MLLTVGMWLRVAEPMVNCRLHNLSMTNTYRSLDKYILSRDVLTPCWRMRKKLAAIGDRSLKKHCKREICHRYIVHIIHDSMSAEEVELSLHNCVSDESERESIGKQVLGRAAFQQHLMQEFQRARVLCAFAVQLNNGLGPSYGLNILYSNSVVMEFFLLGGISVQAASGRGDCRIKKPLHGHRRRLRSWCADLSIIWGRRLFASNAGLVAHGLMCASRPDRNTFATLLLALGFPSNPAELLTVIVPHEVGGKCWRVGVSLTKTTRPKGQ
jgi:hypothetical protein